MKWGLFVLVACVAVLSMAQAPYEHYAGIEVLKFQNDVLPTPSYSGCVDAVIVSSSATTNFGSDDTLGVSSSASGANHKFLIKYDIDAIPDDAVIHRAFLWLAHFSDDCGATSGNATSSGSDHHISVYRVMRDWTEGEVTWNSRKTSPADSAWSTAGCDGTLGGSYLFRGEGSVSVVANARGGVYDTDLNGESYENPAGYYQGVGTDSIFSGYQSTATEPDRNWSPIMLDPFDFDQAVSFGTDVRWVHYDVTEAVRNWHSGTWANFGLVVADSAQVGCVGNFASSDYTTTIGIHPTLEVHYLYATASSGTGGTGTIAGAGPTP